MKTYSYYEVLLCYIKTYIHIYVCIHTNVHMYIDRHEFPLVAFRRIPNFLTVSLRKWKQCDIVYCLKTINKCYTINYTNKYDDPAGNVNCETILTYYWHCHQYYWLIIWQIMLFTVGGWHVRVIENVLRTLVLPWN